LFDNIICIGELHLCIPEKYQKVIMRYSTLHNVKRNNTILSAAKSYIEKVYTIFVLDVSVVCVFYCICNEAAKNPLVSCHHLGNVNREKPSYFLECLLVWNKIRSLI